MNKKLSSIEISKATNTQLLKMEKTLRKEVINNVPIKCMLNIYLLLEVNRELVRRENT